MDNALFGAWYSQCMNKPVSFLLAALMVGSFPGVSFAQLLSGPRPQNPLTPDITDDVDFELDDAELAKLKDAFDAMKVQIEAENRAKTAAVLIPASQAQDPLRVQFTQLASQASTNLEFLESDLQQAQKDYASGKILYKQYISALAGIEARLNGIRSVAVLLSPEDRARLDALQVQYNDANPGFVRQNIEAAKPYVLSQTGGIIAGTAAGAGTTYLIMRGRGGASSGNLTVNVEQAVIPQTGEVFNNIKNGQLNVSRPVAPTASQAVGTRPVVAPGSRAGATTRPFAGGRPPARAMIDPITAYQLARGVQNTIYDVHTLPTAQERYNAYATELSYWLPTYNGNIRDGRENPPSLVGHVKELQDAMAKEKKIIDNPPTSLLRGWLESWNILSPRLTKDELQAKITQTQQMMDFMARNATEATKFIYQSQIDAMGKQLQDYKSQLDAIEKAENDEYLNRLGVT